MILCSGCGKEFGNSSVVCECSENINVVTVKGSEFQRMLAVIDAVRDLLKHQSLAAVDELRKAVAALDSHDKGGE